MTPVAIALVAYASGCSCDPPVTVLTFAKPEICAKSAPLVQEGLRIDFPHLITACHRTGAPLTSPRPEVAP